MHIYIYIREREGREREREHDLFDFPISSNFPFLQGDYVDTRGLTDCLPAEAIRHRTLGTGEQEASSSRGKREVCAIPVPQLNAAKLQRITRQKHLATCNAKQASIQQSSQSDLNKLLNS